MSQHSGELTIEGTIEGTYSEAQPEYGVESAEVTDDIVRESDDVIQEGIEDDHRVAESGLDVQKETADGTIKDTYSEAPPDYEEYSLAPPEYMGEAEVTDDIVRESDATQSVEDEHRDGVFDVHAEAIEGHRWQALASSESFTGKTTQEVEEAMDKVHAFRDTLTNYCEISGRSECLPEGFHDIVGHYREVIHWATDYLGKRRGLPEYKKGLFNKNSAFKRHVDSLYDPLKYFLVAKDVYGRQLEDCKDKNTTPDLEIQGMVKDLLDYEWKIAKQLSFRVFYDTPKSVPGKLDEDYWNLFAETSRSLYLTPTPRLHEKK